MTAVPQELMSDHMYTYRPVGPGLKPAGTIQTHISGAKLILKQHVHEQKQPRN